MHHPLQSVIAAYRWWGSAAFAVRAAGGETPGEHPVARPTSGRTSLDGPVAAPTSGEAEIFAPCSSHCRELLAWTCAVRAEYYRVFLKTVGVDADFINVADPPSTSSTPSRN